MSKQWSRQAYEATAAAQVDVALNRIPGVRGAYKFGRNPDIGTGTIPEDIWCGGGIYPGQPTSWVAETITMASTSTDDNGSGIGARTILIGGLAATGVEREETFTLQGTVPVTSTSTWIRVYAMKVLTAGSSGQNIGTIIVTHTFTIANVFIHCLPGVNLSAICAFTVPLGKTVLLSGYQPSAARGATVSGYAVFQFLLRRRDAVYEVLDFFDTSTTGGSATRAFGGLLAPELSDIVVRVVDVSSNGTTATCRIDYFELNNAILEIT